jgi:hypothetical protein
MADLQEFSMIFGSRGRCVKWIPISVIRANGDEIRVVTWEAVEGPKGDEDEK